MFSRDFTAMAHEMEAMRSQYRQLINSTLPAMYQQPVRFNHCFARIVLDWLFQDCWYRHLHKNKPAYQQLTEKQLAACIQRMQAWIADSNLLYADNHASLGYRGHTARP